MSIHAPKKIVQRIAMKAFIVHEGKVLMLREAVTNPDGTKSGKYMHPGGRVEPGEPFAQALQREIREETGLEVEIGEPFFVGEWFPVIREVPHQIVGTFFECKPLNGTAVTLNNEHDEYRWLGPQDWQQLTIAPPGNSAMEYYFAKQQKLHQG